MIWWYVARASGIVTFVLSGMAVVWGLLLASKFGGGRPAPAWLLNVHRYIGALTVMFTGVHLAGLALDSYVEFGWKELFVPMASSWNPGAVALGIVSFYLLVAVQVSSMFMRRLPRRLWRVIHLSSYGLFWFGLAHGATAGTDASHPAYLAVTIAMTLTVLFLTLYRILTSRTARALNQVRPSHQELGSTNQSMTREAMAT